LHVLNSRPKPAVKSEWEQLQALGDDAKNAVTYKKKKELEMKAHAASRKDQASWNTLFIRGDTVTDSIAAKYGLAKSDILDTTSEAGGAGMAVRMALAETQLINETKRFLAEHGVATAVFDQAKSATLRSDTAIIVKNIPFSTDLDEVRRLFAKYGPLGHVVMPPSKAMVLLEFLEAADAKNAFKNLAYKKFKYVPLYLEWAPKGAFERGASAAGAASASAPAPAAAGVVEGKNKASELLQAAASSSSAAGADGNDDGVDSSTVYVKNLNFNTTEASLKALFAAVAPVRSVSISKKKNTKARAGTSDPAFLSMGYGFVEFRTKADALKAIAALQGAQLDNHALDVKLSSRGATGAAKPAASPAATASAAAAAASGGAAPSSKLLVKVSKYTCTTVAVTSARSGIRTRVAADSSFFLVFFFLFFLSLSLSLSLLERTVRDDCSRVARSLLLVRQHSAHSSPQEVRSAGSPRFCLHRFRHQE
jgi:multiple RNA-binding domain-containing protein 1